MQIESPYHEEGCLCSSALEKLKRLNKMGALLLTKFSKVRSNSLNSSRLLYLAAWIVSRIFGLQYAVIQDLKAVDQHAVEVDLSKHSATGTIRFG